MTKGAQQSAASKRCLADFAHGYLADGAVTYPRMPRFAISSARLTTALIAATAVERPGLVAEADPTLNDILNAIGNSHLNEPPNSMRPRSPADEPEFLGARDQGRSSARVPHPARRQWNAERRKVLR